LAKIFKITDGDLEKDSLKRLKVITGTDIIRQDVREIVLNSLSPDLVSEDGDAFSDLVEGLITLRITAMMEKLQDLFNQTDIERDETERIREIDAVVVRRSKIDPRTMKFWIRLLTLSGTEQEITGEV